MEKAVLAAILSRAICNAICSDNPRVMHDAKEWLYFYKDPTDDELLCPIPDGFIDACHTLDINWANLRDSVSEASKVNPIRHLRLVPKSESC